MPEEMAIGRYDSKVAMTKRMSCLPELLFHSTNEFFSSLLMIEPRKYRVARNTTKILE